MVEIPDPLPNDIPALQKLVLELIRENQENWRRLERMERLIEMLERLAEQKEKASE